MENRENEETQTYTNLQIEIFDHGRFLMKTVVQAEGVEVQQTIVIDSDQAAFIRDFISKYLPESEADHALPEEPEEKGLYVSQNGILLIKDDDGEWTYRKSPYMENAYFEDGLGFIEFADDWRQVVDTIGVEAFPLKHIGKSDVIALAQSKHENEAQS